MPYVMYDSVNANAFPVHGFHATAGYTTGKYPSSVPIRARFPHLPHLTIAISARVDADCLDVEPGDATPAEAPGWFDRRAENRIIYCAASTTNQIRAVMGNRDYLLWTAHYTGKAHICGSGCGYPAADATQWLDRGPNGENVDQSLLSDKFYAAITGEDDMPSSQEVAAAVWAQGVGGQGAAGNVLAQVRTDTASSNINDLVINVFRSDEYHGLVVQAVRDETYSGEFGARINDLVINVLRSPEYFGIVKAAVAEVLADTVIEPEITR